MKKFKIFFLLLVATLLLGACTKDKETLPGGGEYLLSEVWINDLLQSSWSYDEHNRLSSLLMYEGKTVIARTDYRYDEQGRLIEAASAYNNGQEEWVERFEYGGDGMLIRSTTDVNGARHLNHTYTYEKNKVVQVSRSVQGAETVLTQVQDAKGNRIEITSQSGPVWTKSVFGDFDDKKTLNYASDLIKSVNNPRYEKMTSSTGEVREYIYRYTYNEAGYVTASERIDKATNTALEKATYKLIHKK